MISGTATQPGTFTGTIQASNGIGTAVPQSFTIVVYEASDTPTLPPWGIAVLAGALMLAASRLVPPRRIT
jgi:hypothetical protein